MKKERVARGWSLPELSAKTGVNAGHLSRIERGARPPTEAVADACDRAFPERRGWFREYYEESRTWTPPGLRSWAEYEDKARRLSVWSPGIIHGLFQTADYARAFITALPGVTDEVVRVRLTNRMERQKRTVFRDGEPPTVACVIDHPALYRMVGSPEVMVAQLRHLATVAALPNVSLQVLPAIAHPATASELIIADNSAAYCEHLAAGGVYSEDETVTRLDRLFDKLRAESYRASESVAIIRKAAETWTGVSPASVAAMGAV